MVRRQRVFTFIKGSLVRNVGLFWMFAHLEAMLEVCCQQCSTMLWTMLDRRVPPKVILGYVAFMTSLFFPTFCLKKLSSVAACRHPLHFCNTISQKAESCRDGHTLDERLKAPTSGLQGSRKRFSRGGGVGGSTRFPGRWLRLPHRLRCTAWPDVKGLRPRAGRAGGKREQDWKI